MKTQESKHKTMPFTAWRVWAWREQPREKRAQDTPEIGLFRDGYTAQ